MSRRFATLDVFTDRQFTGNPLAVVLDAEGLDGAVMQAIAREFGHPETVFVLPPSEPAHRAHVRIFTPARELPFAGHPTVGTAVLLGLRDRAAAGHAFVLEEGVGPVTCRLERAGVGGGEARFELPQLPQEVGEAPEAAAIAASLGLAAADIGYGLLRPSRWSAGVPVALVPVAHLRAVAACRPDRDRLAAAIGDAPVYVFCQGAVEPGHHFHARMFAPALGIAEDPATGSAAAALAGLLAARGGHGDGEHAFVIEQGYEIGRPSLIRLALQIAQGRLRSASIGGSAVIVTEGTLSA
jgi:trans-2,3-dihydro-3-hydroxyanthranilate isomerase